MASRNFSKFSILIFFILSMQKLAETATNYLSENTVSTNEEFQKSLYSRIPQVYFVPYHKYVQTHNQKYVVSRPESQTPTTVSSAEKTLLSPTYKVALDTTNYATSQVVKPPQGNQADYPYVYALAKMASSTAATYTPTFSATSDNHEKVPKKYHYGYRVSNPHTGTEFGHSEVSDGVSAKGYYHVLLPDGRLQNVKYWAGPAGYHATVTYETQY